MSDSSRRSFLVLAGAGAAAAGTAALLPASADAATPHDAKGPVHAGPLVAHVKDARTGEVAVMAGEHEVVVHDTDLARRLARIASTAR